MFGRRALTTALLAWLPLTALTGCSAIDQAKDLADAVGTIEEDAKRIEEATARAKALTFTATYEQTEGGKTTTLVVAQQPPRSSLTTPTNAYIDDGTDLVSCTLPEAGGVGAAECTKLGPHTEGGFYGGAFALAGAGFGSPLAFLPGLRVAAALGGFEVARGSETFAGQRSDCVSFDKAGAGGGHYTTCTTPDGIVTLTETADGDGSGGTKLVLTRYETTVAPGAFTPPAKAESIDDRLRAATSTTSTTSSSTTTTDDPSGGGTTTSTTLRPFNDDPFAVTSTSSTTDPSGPAATTAG